MSYRCDGKMRQTSSLLTRLKPATGPLLYGVRFWISVCLALYIAYALQLDNAYWAGASAAVVCQPHIGASLRKGWFRVIGTVVGAVFILILTACFPQQRAGFLAVLALWVGASALMASLLRNFMSYAAALSGYTAVIIAGDLLGAVGGASDRVFFYVQMRTSEICIGIVCAGVVLAATDMGDARRRLAALLADITAEITRQFTVTLSPTGEGAPDSRPIRRELIRRVVALEPIIDEAIGESSRLRALSPTLYTAVQDMFGALASWRIVSAHLIERGDLARAEAKVMLQHLPSDLQTASLPPLASATGDFIRLRERYRALARTLPGLPADTPSSRLLTDHTARVFAGASGALNGLVLLNGGYAQNIPRGYKFRLPVADWLPALISAARATVAMGTVELLWVATAWPTGMAALTFAALCVTLFGPREELAFATAMRFVGGTLLSVVCVAAAKFGLLPGLSTFSGFSVALGVFLVPLGALTNQPWQTGTFTAAAALFIPLLSPENQMNYDTQQFYNLALAALVGVGAAALSFRLLPPLTPATRCRRLLARTRRDLRRVATDLSPPTANEWKSLVVRRLSALPKDTKPLQLAQLIAAMSVGGEIVRLRGSARRLGVTSRLSEALDAFAQGSSAMSIRYFATLDKALTARPVDAFGASEVMRARESILLLSEALAQHAEYFDARTLR
jgi:uncharacterized membrane protein YccC